MGQSALLPSLNPSLRIGIHWTIQDVRGQVSRVSTLSPGVRGCRVEWQAARAAKRRSLVVRPIQACRSWPVSELWSAASPLPGFAVRSAGLLAGSIVFPQRYFGRERPPEGAGRSCEHSNCPAPEPGPQTVGLLPATCERPASARQVQRQAHNHSKASRIEESRRVTEKGEKKGSLTALAPQLTATKRPTQSRPGH